MVPDWLAQAAALGWRLLAVVAFGLVVLAAAALLGTVVASVVLAAVVTVAFDPLAERLRASGRSRAAVAGMVTLAAAGTGAVVIVLAVVAFVPAIVDLLRAVSNGLGELQRALESGTIPAPASTLVTDFVTGVTDWISGALAAALSSIANTATILLLAVFLLFFMVNDIDKALAWMLQAAAPQQRAMIAEGTATARLRLGRSLRGTALRSAVTGVVALVVALVFGLPQPLALALLVLAGGFVPLLGPIAATAVVGLVALGSSGLLAAIVAVAALAATPAVLPRLRLPRLGNPGRWQGYDVHPAVVLVALTVGALVAGPAGLILAVPVVLVIGGVAPSILHALDAGADRETEPGLVPRWLDRLAQWSWRLLILAAVAAVGVTALALVPLIVVPLVIAAVAAATLAPGFGPLRARGLTATRTALALTIGGYGIVIAILGITLVALAGPLQDIVANADGAAGKIDDLLATGTSVASIVGAIVPEIARAVVLVIAAVAGVVISLLLGAILTFYLLRDGERGFAVATRPLVSWRRDELADAAGRATSILGNYMIGTGAISAVGAASQFLVMFILGIPLAWPLAILSFFGGFIPYIGSLLTTMLAFLVTVAVGSTQDILIMAIFTLVFNIVQGNIVAPLVYGRAVSIHPAIVLLAIPAGAAVAGIAGMFLAVPVIGVVATTWRTVLRVFGTEPEDRAGEPDADAEPGAGAEVGTAAAAGLPPDLSGAAAGAGT